MELTRTPLLAPKQVPKKSITADMTPLERYNLVVECYNHPCNTIDNQLLAPMPEPCLYGWLYRLSTHLRGKVPHPLSRWLLLFAVACLSWMWCPCSSAST